MAGYIYQEQRKYVFTEDGVIDVIKIKEFADKAIKLAGCVTAGKLINEVTNNWEGLAVIDYLCEIGRLREVKQTEHVAGQDRIFIVP